MLKRQHLKTGRLQEIDRCTERESPGSGDTTARASVALNVTL